jgi:Protein of unknown function (DUF732)
MSCKTIASAVTALFVTGLVFAVPAHADLDTDFENQLQSLGIYGERDYNAWVGKITCKRLHTGVDSDPDKSAHFVFVNLPRGTTTTQVWQFLGAAISTYCPAQAPVLQRALEPGNAS